MHVAVGFLLWRLCARCCGLLVMEAVCTLLWDSCYGGYVHVAVGFLLWRLCARCCGLLVMEAVCTHLYVFLLRTAIL